MRVSSFKVLSVCFLVLALVSPHPSAATPKAAPIILKNIIRGCVAGYRLSLVAADNSQSSPAAPALQDFLTSLDVKSWCASICHQDRCSVEQYDKENAGVGAGTTDEFVMLLKNLGFSFNTVHNTFNAQMGYVAWMYVEEHCVCSRKVSVDGATAAPLEVQPLEH
jgi:hypothetical protein